MGTNKRTKVPVTVAVIQSSSAKGEDGGVAARVLLVAALAVGWLAGLEPAVGPAKGA